VSLNRVAAIFKVGDNSPYMDGNLICYIDEAEWGLPLEKIISAFTTRVFCCMIVDRKFLKIKEKALAQIYDSELLDADGMRIGKLVHNSSIKTDFKYLEARLVQPGLEDKLRSKVDNTGLIDGTALSETDFTDPRDDKHVNPIPDLNAVTSGSYTVGAGGNYATWALAFADIGTMTGDLTFTQISATTETANATKSVNFGAGNYTLTLTSNNPPLGNPSGGWVSSWNAAVNCVTINGSVNPGIIRISHMNFKRLVEPASSSVMLYFGNSAIAGTVSYVNDIILNVNNVIFTAGRYTFGAYLQDVDVIHNWFNALLVNNNSNTASGVAIGGGLYGINSVFENISVYNASGSAKGFLFSSTNASIKKNLAVFTLGTCFTNVGEGTFSKCASSDTTGSEEGLKSLVAATEFESLDSASTLFLKAKMGSTLGNGGTATSITANTYGIRGNQRPRGAKYSIGADELQGRGMASVLNQSWGQM
jgi:hypothetical protein